MTKKTFKNYYLSTPDGELVWSLQRCAEEAADVSKAVDYAPVGSWMSSTLFYALMKRSARAPRADDERGPRAWMVGGKFGRPVWRRVPSGERLCVAQTIEWRCVRRWWRRRKPWSFVGQQLSRRVRRRRTPSKGLGRGFVRVPWRQDSSRNRRVTKMWSVVALPGVKVHGILVARQGNCPEAPVDV